MRPLAIVLALLAAPLCAHPVTEAERAGARAYLEAGLPPLPAAWRRGAFEPEPGVVLETGFLPATAPRRGTVVFAPGFSAPLEMYAETFAALAAGGWDVAALSTRGQGRSARLGGRPDVAHLEDYADPTADLARFVARQRGPVAVVAASQGAHVALRAGVERAMPAAAYALVVPMVEVETGPLSARAVERLAALGDPEGAILGRGGWDGHDRFAREGGTAEGTFCFDDPARAHVRHALMTLDPALRVDATSRGWVRATMRSQRVLPALARRLEAPVLMLTAGADTVVRSDAARALCAAMPDCRAEEAPGAKHCMLEEGGPLADRLAARILAFLAAEVP